MTAKQLAGPLIYDATKSDSKRDYGSASVIVAAISIWLGSLMISVLVGDLTIGNARAFSFNMTTDDFVAQVWNGESATRTALSAHGC
jgi:hypothetical protein